MERRRELLLRRGGERGGRCCSKEGALISLIYILRVPSKLKYPFKPEIFKK